MSLNVDHAIESRFYIPGAAELSVLLWLNLNTDGDALAPLIMLSDGIYLFGLYVDSDGVTLRLSDPFPYEQAPTNAGLGALSTGAWTHLALTRAADLTFKPYKAGLPGTAYKPTLTPMGAVTQVWPASDSVQFNDVLIGYMVIVPRLLSDADIAAAAVSATPWELFPDRLAYLQGTGPNLAAASAAAVADSTSFTVGNPSYSSDNPAFGSTLSGQDTLDIT